MTELFGFLGASIYGEKEAAMPCKPSDEYDENCKLKAREDADKIIQHATLLTRPCEPLVAAFDRPLTGIYFASFQDNLVKGQKPTLLSTAD